MYPRYVPDSAEDSTVFVLRPRRALSELGSAQTGHTASTVPVRAPKQLGSRLFCALYACNVYFPSLSLFLLNPHPLLFFFWLLYMLSGDRLLLLPPLVTTPALSPQAKTRQQLFSGDTFRCVGCICPLSVRPSVPRSTDSTDVPAMKMFLFCHRHYVGDTVTLGGYSLQHQSNRKRKPQAAALFPPHTVQVRVS